MTEAAAAAGARNNWSFQRTWFLALLVAVGTCSAVDRQAFAAMGPAIIAALGLSDFQLGLTSGLGFALVYAVLGLPLARIADRGNRAWLIAVSVGVWSICELLSSRAGSFVQLMLCRAVIGVGEAGVQPTSVSLVSDLYPRSKRGTALGIMALGVPIGTVLGSSGGGYLAEIYDWRTVMVGLGVLGILLALLFLASVREPQRGTFDPPQHAADAPSVASVARLLGSKPTFWHAIVAVAVINVAIYGIGIFLPMYFTRVMRLGLGETGLIYGIVGAISTIGYFFGGAITDRLARRDERWHAWFAAIGVLIGGPFYILTFQTLNPVLATVLLTIAGTAMFVYYTPVQVILQNMVAPRMRATTAFLFFLASGLIGAGLGPMLVGLISDFFTARAFHEGDFTALCNGTHADAANAVGAACRSAAATGIRSSLTVISLLFFWAALHLLFAARHLRRDVAVGERVELAA